MIALRSVYNSESPDEIQIDAAVHDGAGSAKVNTRVT